MPDRDDGFLSRWSRRKEETRREEEDRKTEGSVQQQEEMLPAASDSTGETDEALLESLPDIDSMTLDSDFRPFLRSEVPQILRRKALRKLWRLDPVFANLDGLNDYDEDYTKVGKVPIEGLRSLFRPGRGMISQEEAEGEDTKAADNGAAQAAVEESKQAEEAEAEETPQALTAETADETQQRLPNALADESLNEGAGAQRDHAVTASDEVGSPPLTRPQRGNAAARRWGRFSS